MFTTLNPGRREWMRGVVIRPAFAAADWAVPELKSVGILFSVQGLACPGKYPDGPGRRRMLSINRYPFPLMRFAQNLKRCEVSTIML
jgi:hypothetical protein